ncbi:lachesin-like [Physella acuta]|uniref:lachesin-like n=1 Tax=Physella acuta TaxID=109671 RepID=UPI0027DAE06B|nr:lachesin-like [Physella acuta]
MTSLTVGMFDSFRGLLISYLTSLASVWLLCYLSANLVPVSGSHGVKLNTTEETVTVVAGKRAILPCSVDSIADLNVFRNEYKVIWVNPRKTVMSLGDRRLIDDSRVSVERPYMKIWNLLIRDVRHNDSGTYQCQVNTFPEQIKKVNLDVKVPPMIHNNLSTDKVDLKEHETATLVCNVSGVPHPNVTWFKRDTVLKQKERIGTEGEVLIIHNITRVCQGTYECYVDNGVPPALTKAIRVVVNYAPKVYLDGPKRLGQSLGKETIVECHVSAHPQSETSWRKGGRILSKGEKYDIQVFVSEEENTVILALRIRDITPDDFGHYDCVASNAIGSDKDTFILHETITTTTTEPPKVDSYNPDQFEEPRLYNSKPEHKLGNHEVDYHSQITEIQSSNKGVNMGYDDSDSGSGAKSETLQNSVSAGNFISPSLMYVEPSSLVMYKFPHYSHITFIPSPLSVRRHRKKRQQQERCRR